MTIDLFFGIFNVILGTVFFLTGIGVIKHERIQKENRSDLKDFYFLAGIALFAYGLFKVF